MPLLLDVRQAAENAVRRAAGALAFAKRDDPAARVSRCFTKPLPQSSCPTGWQADLKVMLDACPIE